MRVDLDIALQKIVTVINRIDGNPDTYRKTVISSAQFDEVTLEATQGDQTLDVGSIFKIQLPIEDGDHTYQEYADFVLDQASYTCRIHDWIVLGEVVETITTDNLRSVLKGYDKVCQVTAVSDKRGRGVESRSKTGAMRFLHFVYAEGM